MTSDGDTSTTNLFGLHQLSTHKLGTSPIFSWTPTKPVCSTSSVSRGDQRLQEDGALPIMRDGRDGGGNIPIPGLQDVRSGALLDGTTSVMSAEISDVLVAGTDFSSDQAEDDQQLLEQYANDLVPALHMINKSTHMDMQDIFQRQEAFKLTANAVLGARASGTAWGKALIDEGVRAMAAIGNAPLLDERSVQQDGDQGHAGASFGGAGSAEVEGDVDNFGPADAAECMAMEDTQNNNNIGESCAVLKSDVECASSSSYSEFSDHACFDSVRHRHESTTASLASSDYSSIVDSTTSSELMQDEIIDCALQYSAATVQSTAPASCRKLAENIGCNVSNAAADDGTAKLLMRSTSSTSVQPAASLKEENHAYSSSNTEELYGEINARLAMIRGCCKGQWRGSEESTAMDAPAMSERLVTSHNYAAAAAAGSRAALISISKCQNADGVLNVEAAGIPHHKLTLPSYDQMHDDVACHDSLSDDVAPLPQLDSAEVALCISEDANVDFHNSRHVHDATYSAGAASAAQLSPVLQRPYCMTCAAGAKLAQHNIVNINMTGQLYRCESDVEGAQEDGVDQNGHVDTAEAMLATRVELDRQRGSYSIAGGSTLKGGSHVARPGDDGVRVDALSQAREMMYTVAAYRPIDWGSIMDELVEGKERPRRRNVRISEEPQSVAARRRRERISDRIRILQRLVPGASKLDTASMLDEAIHYLKFLKLQVQALRHLDKLYSFPAAAATILPQYVPGLGGATAPPHHPPPPAAPTSPSCSSSSSQYFPQPPACTQLGPNSTPLSFTLSPSLLKI